MRRMTEIRVALEQAGHRRAAAEHHRAEAMRDLATTIRAAHKQGLPVAEIARLAGTTRQTVYDILHQ